MSGRRARADARAGRKWGWSAESSLQVLIMLVIGGAAGAASFRHVHDVAATHGQAGWIAWADAVVLELMSIASGLELRRRKRLHAPLRFPSAVLAVAVTLSLGAQVVEAEASVIGWIAAAIPALGFLVMVKIAMAPVGESGADEGAVVDANGPSESKSDPDVAGDDVAAALDDDPVVRVLVPAARAAAEALHRQGRRVTRTALADVLRADGYGVSNKRVSALLKEVAAELGAEMSPTGLPGVLPAVNASAEAG